MDTGTKKHKREAEYDVLPRKRQRTQKIEEKWNLLAVRPDGEAHEGPSAAPDLVWIDAIDQMYFATHGVLLANVEPDSPFENEVRSGYEGLPWSRRPLTKYAESIWHAARLGSLVAFSRVMDMFASCDFYKSRAYYKEVSLRLRNAWMQLRDRLSAALSRVPQNRAASIRLNYNDMNHCVELISEIIGMLSGVRVGDVDRRLGNAFCIGLFSQDQPGLLETAIFDETLPEKGLDWIPKQWKHMHLCQEIAPYSYLVRVPPCNRVLHLLPQWSSIEQTFGLSERPLPWTELTKSERAAEKKRISNTVCRILSSGEHRLLQDEAETWRALHSPELILRTHTPNAEAQHIIIHKALKRISDFHLANSNATGQVPSVPAQLSLIDCDVWIWQFQNRPWVYEEQMRFAHIARHYEDVFQTYLVHHLIKLLPEFDVLTSTLISDFIIAPF